MSAKKLKNELDFFFHYLKNKKRTESNVIFLKFCLYSKQFEESLVMAKKKKLYECLHECFDSKVVVVFLAASSWKRSSLIQLIGLSESVFM